MKLVINGCYGGFSLSPKGERLYLERQGKQLFRYKQTSYMHESGKEEYARIDDDSDPSFSYSFTKDYGKLADKKTLWENREETYFYGGDLKRDDPDLVAILEEHGPDIISGSCAYLEIVEIPDDVEWEIDEYDGMESIHEKHRVWQ